MNRTSRISALLVAAAFALGALPAAAQYANEYSPAKLLKQGKTSQPIAGNGTVIVQVQVNPDGTHKAIKVIKSTNAGDNDAAMEIAQNSSYRPAHKGSTPIAAFYDYTLKFTGKSVANGGGGSGSSGSVSPAAAQIAALIRAKQYTEAASKAKMALLSAPGDDSLRQMLGIAAFDSDDYETAAASFAKVATIGKQFQPLAAASFAAAAAKLSQDNPALSLTYAQKAVALNPDTNSRYALGVAQLGNKQYSDAIATLKAVHETAFADPKTPKNVKTAIDSSLMLAYLQTNDSQNAQAIGAEIKQIDPTSTLAARVLGNHYLKMGIDAMTAKQNDEAFKDFDMAIQQGDTDVTVTAATQAAFLVAKTDKPDYKKMQAYAEQALAAKPDDAQANFAEGIALAGQWVASHDDTMKKKSMDALTKADSFAKAEGNEALALSIESFIKNSFTSGGGGH